MKPIIITETPNSITGRVVQSLETANNDARIEAKNLSPGSRIRVVLGGIIPEHWDYTIGEVPREAFDSEKGKIK